MFLTLVYFVLALFLLITIHEYGHFLVARLCGVKVLRFSFGFGRVLSSWRDRLGTEYVWSLFPLGGYVKMLDEANEPVPEEERPYAFNNQSLLARVAIVVAGPLFNLLFAFLTLWLALMIGTQSIAPIVEENSPRDAKIRGSFTSNIDMSKLQEITAINGEKVSTWNEVQYALMALIGTDAPVALQLKSLNNGMQSTRWLPFVQLPKEGLDGSILNNIGLKPFAPIIPPVVGTVLKASPAARADLQMGDRILSVNGRVMNDWLDLVSIVRSHPNQTISITVLRGELEHTISVALASTSRHGQTEGFLGAMSQKLNWPKHWFRTDYESPTHAISKALYQTIYFTKLSFSLVGKLICGKLPVASISGPVGIAQGAGESGRSGIASYLYFLALISVSLAVLNLLPIPMLDGGYLLYFLLELVLRRPISDQMKSIGVSCGLGLLITLTVLALHNDLTRLLGS